MPPPMSPITQHTRREMMADTIYDILTRDPQATSTTASATPQRIAQQANGVTTSELPQTSQEDNAVSEPSDDLISLNSPQFREYLAQFIACTNNIINDLLQRVEALEAELQRPSSCRSSDLSQ